MHDVRSFPPVVGPRPKVLILGSAPSRASLEAGAYYAHRSNQFWPIMCELLHGDTRMTYPEQYRMLTANGIALWDVVHSCTRKGSADADIKDAQPHDIPGFLARYPSIHSICFNGTASERIYRRHFSTPSGSTHLLPSTSAARAMPWVQKMQSWSLLIKLIHPDRDQADPY